MQKKLIHILYELDKQCVELNTYIESNIVLPEWEEYEQEENMKRAEARWKFFAFMKAKSMLEWYLWLDEK